MKAIVYPNLLVNGMDHNNPYIRDFIAALKRKGIEVKNPAHKNPLISICFKKIDSDIYIFHWLEDVANFKYGYLQMFLALNFIFRIKFNGKTIVWFLHNKDSHTQKHKFSRRILQKRLIKASNLIITHATEGIDIIDKKYREKVKFINHPTKNRLNDHSHETPSFDLLIWGTITRYKGVAEFLNYAKSTDSKLLIHIVGKCNDPLLIEEIQKTSTPNTKIENRSTTFEELSRLIGDSKFILIPYSPKSILSSGILMDSLSYGARIIGPNVGSFRDYSENPLLNVYTFDNFNEIETIVETKNSPVNIDSYREFLESNSWDNFIEQLLLIIKD